MRSAGSFSTRRFAIAVGVTALAGISACSSPDTAADRPASIEHVAPSSTPPQPSASTSAAPTTVRLVAAGDIACNPLDEKYDLGEGEETGCRQKATAKLIGPLRPDAVMPLGDSQYQRGTYSGYMHSYALTWGRYIKITHPVIGNHDYFVPRAIGYFQYFGRLAGDPNKGYYSFDLGNWHILSLNDAGCRENNRCEAGSAEERWLRADLQEHQNKCTLAAWHEPRWSSGQHGDNPGIQKMWADLYAAGVDVALSGHDHDYERFRPLDADGRPDLKRGIREFVVGTGGVGLRPFKQIKATSVVHQNTIFGVLDLTLRPDSYSWRFVPLGNGFHDSGQGKCH
jgi:hypothetical protein